MKLMRRTENILEEYRQKEGLSQEELAKKLEMSRAYIAGILTGSRNPSQKTLDKMCKVLKIEDSMKAEIELYEAFRKAPALVQYNYFDMQHKLVQKDIELDNFKSKLDEYKDLDELKSILSNYVSKQIENLKK